ncbi:MAG: efflux RND transporter permease subunit [Alistipes sp.]|uniref:efflux RND transporter permease subunit n=1 Tax=Alistipes sp. TaxID=1872444 RepID=UPI0025C1ABB1|nr:efflux RND transporter permease subunit [Alistipes sp.]MCD8275800.1 efflux RND transporter permease subunit [Alistipes sp.]
MSIYKSAVERPIMTALIFAAVAIFGLFSLTRLSINLLPDIESNAIMVMTTYEGASAEDIETNVTKVLENTLNSVSDLKHITSQSKENISIISLEFEYGIDIDVATNDVRDKLDMVSSSLPDEVGTPIIFKFGSDDIPILILSVTAEESMPGLYKILDDNVSTPLARVGGVGQISILGIAEREIQVYCDPYKLEAYGLSIETIASIIANENKNVPAGNIDVGSNTYSVRVQKEFEVADEMLSLVVATSADGAPVYLRDVATVTDTQEERTQESYTDGNKGGMIVIQKQSGANAVDISRKIQQRLPAIQETLPADVKLGVIIDTADNIHDTIDSLKETIATILIVVMLVVLLFLGRWRATFVIVLTIPISLLAALIYLLATGETINIISMSALSIAIGMVVDNAIVVLENITTHIERGSRPRQAAVFATNEVSVSVMASTLTTIAVFLPLTMITGMAGVLFKQLGWMVTIILTVSTVAALTLTPSLSAQMLGLSTRDNLFQKWVSNPFNRFFDRLNGWYASILDWAVHHRGTTVFSALVLFALVIVGVGGLLKTEYFPTQDNARLSLTIELPFGTRQEITADVAQRLTARFQEEFPEISVLNYSFGQADTDNVFASISDNGTYLISYNIRLVPKTERERGLTQIADRMRSILTEYPELKTYEVIEGGQQGGVGGQASVDIEIYGHDFTATDTVAADIAARMEQVKGCTQVNISRDEYTPEYQVDFDREKLALNGLNSTTAAGYLRNRINGSVGSYFREDGDEYDIRVRYDRRFRESVEDIENITIYNSQGKGVKIRDLGRVVETQTPPTIERKDRERLITVSCVVGTGAAMSDIVEAARQQMNEIELPAGITWQFGGTFEDQEDTFRDLATLMVLMILLVFIIMAAQFESLTYPFVIMFSIPFALIGVFLGLWITGTPLGVMAMLGILMLIGIVVNNGIVLIDYIRLRRRRGMNTIHAIVTAGRSRLRPVLMTTFTTVIGMVPMAVNNGVGSEMWKSLGISVAWGLSFSTVVTLILVPTLYCSFTARGIRRQRKQSLKTIE